MAALVAFWGGALLAALVMYLSASALHKRQKVILERRFIELQGEIKKLLDLRQEFRVEVIQPLKVLGNTTMHYTFRKEMVLPFQPVVGTELTFLIGNCQPVPSKVVSVSWSEEDPVLPSIRMEPLSDIEGHEDLLDFMWLEWERFV